MSNEVKDGSDGVRPCQRETTSYETLRIKVVLKREMRNQYWKRGNERQNVRYRGWKLIVNVPG